MEPTKAQTAIKRALEEKPMEALSFVYKVSVKTLYGILNGTLEPKQFRVKAAINKLIKDYNNE